MKRADKIRLAEEAAAAEKAADTRDNKQREEARQEWGKVRKAAREAFLAQGDWRSILNEYRDRPDGESFYTPAERARMCAAYADELVMNQFR